MMVKKSIMMMLHLGEVLCYFGAQQISNLFSCWTKNIATHSMGIVPELLNIDFINDDDDEDKIDIDMFSIFFDWNYCNGDGDDEEPT